MNAAPSSPARWRTARSRRTGGCPVPPPCARPWFAAPALLVTALGAQVPAFPGAEGFGRHALGGRGGDVYHVTTLADAGPGSLRDGIASATGPRTVVFAVSGTIALESPLDVNRPHLTLAGQTAPGDGITLRNHALRVAADHVIIRYLRSRLGDLGGKPQDAISVNSGRHIILDHCSASWGIDECLSAQSGDVDLLTVQWCLVAESLHQSIHNKGGHGKGGIIGSLRQSYHHNLFAHHMDRNPKISWRRHCQVDFRNNVIFNWGNASCHDGAHAHVNWADNYYQAGPATRAAVRTCLFRIQTRQDDIPEPPRFYIAGNHLAGEPGISADNWAGGVFFGEGAGPQHRAAAPFPYPAISYATSAVEARPRVLAGAGASRVRDAVDRRVIEDLHTGRPRLGRNGIIDSQRDVGGWPELRSLPAPADTDRDGMPDAWEKSHGLDPRDPADRNAFTIDRTYTNLEVYLSRLAGG